MMELEARLEGLGDEGLMQATPFKTQGNQYRVLTGYLKRQRAATLDRPFRNFQRFSRNSGSQLLPRQP